MFNNLFLYFFILFVINLSNEYTSNLHDNKINLRIL